MNWAPIDGHKQQYTMYRCSSDWFLLRRGHHWWNHYDFRSFLYPNGQWKIRRIGDSEWFLGSQHVPNNTGMMWPATSYSEIAPFSYRMWHGMTWVTVRSNEYHISQMRKQQELEAWRAIFPDDLSRSMTIVGICGISSICITGHHWYTLVQSSELNTKGRKDISLVEKVTNIHNHCQNMGSQRWRMVKVFLCFEGGSPPWNADLWNPECLVGCWMTFANRRSLVQHYH